MIKIITYGTFDTLHFGHILLLKRARAFGDHLTVGLSSDFFNETKGKKSFFKYQNREEMLLSIRYVDDVIPEKSWDQKIDDIKRLNIHYFVMGDDWRGRFNDLNDLCDVRYIDRTPNVSSTLIKSGFKRMASG